LHEPGSTISVKIFLNSGDKKLPKVQLKLKKILKFVSNQTNSAISAIFEEKSVVASASIKLPAATHFNAIEANLKLPDILDPSNTQFCNVVQVSYELQVLVLGSKVKFPITIASVASKSKKRFPENQLELDSAFFHTLHPINFF
jgi:hypothetical protein